MEPSWRGIELLPVWPFALSLWGLNSKVVTLKGFHTGALLFLLQEGVKAVLN